MRFLRVWVWIGIIVVLAIIVGFWAENQLKKVRLPEFRFESPTPVPENTFLVIRVVDGDTVELESGQKVRYIGMDTPEVKTCFGDEATIFNKSLVENKEVTLEKDVSETDKYGRWLRYVYIDGKMVNEILVREGYAKIDTYPPDVKYKDVFLGAEKEARLNNKGLWSKCK